MSKSTLKPTDEDSAVDVEEAPCVRVLDEHALGVAGDEILGGRACVLGGQDGWAHHGRDRELAVGAAEPPCCAEVCRVQRCAKVTLASRPTSASNLSVPSAWIAA
jgi:hypothetical protein